MCSTTHHSPPHFRSRASQRKKVCLSLLTRIHLRISTPATKPRLTQVRFSSVLEAIWPNRELNQWFGSGIFANQNLKFGLVRVHGPNSCLFRKEFGSPRPSEPSVRFENRHEPEPEPEPCVQFGWFGGSGGSRTELG
jgi:hypothetical protein